MSTEPREQGGLTAARPAPAALLCLLLAVFGSACALREQPAAQEAGTGPASAPAQSRLSVPVAAETEATLHEANAVALWVNSTDPGASRIYGSGGTAGVEV
jgi:hypothetical protein